MRRAAGIVLDVGRGSDGRVWCEIDRPFFSTGDAGRVGPFALHGIDTKTNTARQRCILGTNADPRVGEVVALVRIPPARKSSPYVHARRLLTPDDAVHPGSTTSRQGSRP